jgi:hypothetical protein
MQIMLATTANIPNDRTQVAQARVIEKRVRLRTRNHEVPKIPAFVTVSPAVYWADVVTASESSMLGSVRNSLRRETH